MLKKNGKTLIEGHTRRLFWPQAKKGGARTAMRVRGGLAFKRRTLTYWKIEISILNCTKHQFHAA